MTDRFRGTYTVMVTAFDAQGRVDLEAQARFTDWQVREGIHGLIPLGSTGEFLSMSTQERRAVAKCVIDTVAGRVPVLVGAGAESTDEVIDNVAMAEELGADGTMIIPPFYSTPTWDELIHHFGRIGQAATRPVMIYNNPATANVDLVPPLVAELSRLPRIDYIKESTMDVTRIRDILDMSEGRMTVFGGIMGFESFVEGAEGWVAVGSNIMPAALAKLFTLTADDEDYHAARTLYRKVLPIIRLVAGHRYVSGSKAALELIGMPMGAPRAPRLPLPENEMGEVRTALSSVGLLPRQVA
ncbi:MAG: dihydrodipicolinate synthase family protein [Rhizobiales bacterium]|nr:dihydrodipicolinate synthase family protein [Hyphomicrobiales bacterium]MBO6700361.1 dihydrodipicolinate synthase family protein [Hyphomicrobiales bacterium]MBO6737475.1 dihydrodipicolinate synthase family protein [Hyphomicrobiales bacterium]MBO6913468.1 dihydrodipicolinate synthase family protein [Hyphomicrobiales bacterium]MBO6955399.1 dihydrodipicolinate synthase family protein [Hyphomicrobiales bacterium]